MTKYVFNEKKITLKLKFIMQIKLKMTMNILHRYKFTERTSDWLKRTTNI